MLTGMFALTLILSPSSSPPVPIAAARADTLQCQVQAAADDHRRCRVRVPEGRRIKACSEVDGKAGRCDATGEGRYVVWYVATGGAKCKISRKRTDWTSRVTLSMKDGTPAGPATCDLYVVLE